MIRIHDCEVAGKRVDVTVDADRVTQIRDVGERTGERGEGLVIEARGGCLLPGLHDHHLHLYATAAALDSLACGPPDVLYRDSLAQALGQAEPRAGWIRGGGYHESVAGVLDRALIDELRADHPVRVQDRSGSLWSLNSAALEALRITAADQEPGLERDADGRPTGRLFRMDAWLRERMGGSEPPALGPLSERLARFGITSVTDAGADNDAAFAERLRAAQRSGELHQRVLVLGAAGGQFESDAQVSSGCMKILLDEARLPALEPLVARIREAHAAGRGVAIHAVTRTELMLALGAIEEAGASPDDRIEHASVAAPEAVAWVQRLGIRVVTQPIFIHDRGDAYLRDVEGRDQPWLYRGRAWLDAGVPLAGGSDAPYGSVDPWQAMATAVSRRTRTGEPLSLAESLSAEEALGLFLSPPEAPGSAPRRVEVGSPADLCLLDRAWSEARLALGAECVAATICSGRLAWQAPPRFG